MRTLLKRRVRKPKQLPPMLARQRGPLIELHWVADIPVATIVEGDPVAVALWLHQVKDGVSIHA